MCRLPKVCERPHSYAPTLTLDADGKVACEMVMESMSMSDNYDLIFMDVQVSELTPDSAYGTDRFSDAKHGRPRGNAYNTWKRLQRSNSRTICILRRSQRQGMRQPTQHHATN